MLSWSNNLILDINSNIFCHLKLEIALAIPASNDGNTIEAIQQDKG